MEIVSGFTIIAKEATGRRHEGKDEFTILAVRDDKWSGTGFEYVTSEWLEGNTGWHGNGHYGQTLRWAVADYEKRVGRNNV